MTGLRVLCTGSRSWDRQDVVDQVLDILARSAAAEGVEELTVVHGACFPPPNADGSMPARSADWLVELWARRWGHPLKVRIERHPANWREHGRAAGPRRNEEMTRLGADVCFAWIRDHSKGASNCAELAERAGIPVQILEYDGLPEPAEVS